MNDWLAMHLSKAFVIFFGISLSYYKDQDEIKIVRTK